MSDLVVTCSRCKCELHHYCNQESLPDAAADLFMWRPFEGFPKALKKGNDFCDGSEDLAEVPFISEAFLYPLLGKEDARTFMAQIKGLFYAMGLDPNTFMEKAYEALEKKKRDKEAEEQRRVEGRKRYHEGMQPVTRTKQATFTICTYRNFYAFDHNVRDCERGTCHEKQKPGEPYVLRGKGLELVAERTADLGIRVSSCPKCKRIHVATPEQAENWRTEPGYRVSEERRRQHGSKPEHWIASEAVRKVFGIKDDDAPEV